MEKKQEQEEQRKENIDKGKNNSKGSKLNSWFFLIIVNVVVSVVVSVVVVMIYMQKFWRGEIAIADLSGFIIGLRNGVIMGKLTEKEAMAKLDEAIKLIEEAAKDKIVLNAEVVLGRNNRVRIIKLPELPQEVYRFDVEEYFNSLKKGKKE